MTAATRWEACAVSHLTRVRDRLDQVLLGADYEAADLDNLVRELGRAAAEVELAERNRARNPEHSQLHRARNTVAAAADQLAGDDELPTSERHRLATALYFAAATMDALT